MSKVVGDLEDIVVAAVTIGDLAGGEPITDRQPKTMSRMEEVKCSMAMREIVSVYTKFNVDAVSMVSCYIIAALRDEWQIEPAFSFIS